jgi:hypothetical protein
MAFARSADHLDPDPIELAQLLAPRPAASVIYRMKGRGMEDEGIRPGDILILERAQPLRAGQIALVSVDGGRGSCASKVARVGSASSACRRRMRRSSTSRRSRGFSGFSCRDV